MIWLILSLTFFTITSAVLVNYASSLRKEVDHQKDLAAMYFRHFQITLKERDELLAAKDNKVKVSGLYEEVSDRRIRLSK